MKTIEDMQVSVIIAAYNRKNELKALLRSLCAQTLPPDRFEIIVVDDGSSDGTGEWLLRNRDRFTVPVIPCSQPRGGPGAARNAGMERARGDLFAFTDTDCIAQPEWLASLIGPFASEGVGAVGGSEMVNEEDPPLMRCFHYLMTAPLTTGGLRGKRGKRLAHFYPRTFNMAISREAYRRTGGFKPLFHAEDIELSYRVREEGYTLVYEDSARVYHRRRSTVPEFARQLFAMGKARVALWRIHPASLEPLHVLPSAVLAVLFLLAFLAACWQPALPLFLASCGVGLLFLIALGLDGFLKLRSPVAFSLIPFLFILQQGAYGAGFIAALLHRR